MANDVEPSRSLEDWDALLLERFTLHIKQVYRPSSHRKRSENDEKDFIMDARGEESLRKTDGMSNVEFSSSAGKENI